MVAVKKALLLIGCFIPAACGMEMNGVLGRITADPFTEIPNARSFNGDFSIVISWSKDEAADEYYLYRAKDDITPVYQLVYKGPLTEYQDVFSLSQEESLYLYRLGKRRGQKLFADLVTRGQAALGVVSGSRRDVHEPNDAVEEATVLKETELYANGWYYASNTLDNVAIYDMDWYCIDIYPHWTAAIILTDLDVPAYSTNNHFFIEILNIGSEEIVSEAKKDITNPNNYPDRLYFRIYPNFAQFENYTLPSGGCGKFIRYTLRVAELRPE